MADNTTVRTVDGGRIAAPASKTPNTAILVLSDGSVFRGGSCGADGDAGGLLCCNTAMAGYQEILSDASYAGSILAFTFPHVGIVGANPEDMESPAAQARGCILAEAIGAPANFRATSGFADWLRAQGVVAISGIDTRALMRRSREQGPLHAVIATSASGEFDLDALRAKAASAAPAPTPAQPTTSPSAWTQGGWELGSGYRTVAADAAAAHVVVVDCGAKYSLLRQLAGAGLKVTLVPPTTDLAAVTALQADALFVSNGPGDPGASPARALVAGWLTTGKPLFAVGLGMQLLALALGARTQRLQQGRYGVNHPVQCLADRRVEAVAMHHIHAVERASLPANVRETHVSLFDGTPAGIEVVGQPVSGVQFHPETPPWHADCHPLFQQFVDTIRKAA